MKMLLLIFPVAYSQIVIKLHYLYPLNGLALMLFEALEFTDVIPLFFVPLEEY